MSLGRDSTASTRSHRAGYNRWLIPPAALAIHLCIGQVYATSVYKTILVEHFDTSLTAVGIVFSIAIVMLGLSAAVFGTWVDTGGPRRAMVAAALAWSTGLPRRRRSASPPSQIWLLYLGYGVIGGIGLGIGYISPVSTLIKWFPDRPGLATGLAIMGFGGGALVASPVESKLLAFYDSGFDPEDVTSVASGSAVARDVRHARPGLPRRDALRRLAGQGARRRLACPRASTRSTVKSKSMVTTASVSRRATPCKTPQFWLLWVVLFCNVTAGIGILEQAAPMIQDFFRAGGGSSVDPAAAAGFVGLLSICNMAGRFVWSSTSDVVGRKPIYMGYLGIGMVLYALLALDRRTARPALFVLFAGIIISFYGGGFATVPAYLRDLFGTFQVGAIHGRLLTAWSAAGVAGPLIVNGFLDAEGTPGQLTDEAYKPGPADHGRRARGRLRRQPADPPGRRPVPRARPRGDPADRRVDPARRRGRRRPRPAPAPRRTTRPVLLVVSWAVVGLPLVYGVYQTVREGLEPVRLSRRRPGGRMGAMLIHPWDEATRDGVAGRARDRRLRPARHRRPRRRLPGRRTHPLRVRRRRDRPAAPRPAQPGLAGARRRPARRARADRRLRLRRGGLERQPRHRPGPRRADVATTPASSCSAAPRSSTTPTRRPRSSPSARALRAGRLHPRSRPAPTSRATGGSCPASAGCGCTSRRVRAEDEVRRQQDRRAPRRDRRATSPSATARLDAAARRAPAPPVRPRRRLGSRP